MKDERGDYEALIRYIYNKHTVNVDVNIAWHNETTKLISNLTYLADKYLTAEGWAFNKYINVQLLTIAILCGREIKCDFFGIDCDRDEYLKLESEHLYVLLNTPNLKGSLTSSNINDVVSIIKHQFDRNTIPGSLHYIYGAINDGPRDLKEELSKLDLTDIQVGLCDNFIEEHTYYLDNIPDYAKELFKDVIDKQKDILAALESTDSICDYIMENLNA